MEALTASQALTFVGSVLMTVTMALAAWALKKVVELEVRLRENEARDQVYREAMEQRFRDYGLQCSRCMDGLTASITEVKASMKAVHERLDKIIGDRQR